MSALNEVLSRTFFVPPAAARSDAAEFGTVRRQAFVPEMRAVDEQARTITFVASTEAVDRYGDRILVKGWKLDAYKKNPVFLFGHRSQDPPIGKTVSLSIEMNPPALVQKVQFADAATYPFADTIYNLYKGGFMRAVSVGFRPLEQPTPIFDDATGRMTGMEFTSQELLELSAVPIPANVDAVARAISTGVVTEADVERCFSTSSRGGELATREDWDSLLLSLEKLAAAVERLKGRIGGAEAAKITTAEEFAAAVRGEAN